jgi:outer membrane receptor protein involved in Fe transport
MHTDDWNPKLYILPHKQRDDYSLYGKWLFVPSGKLRLSLGGAKSRTQFDRYSSIDKFYKFHLDHYRSDMRKGDLQTLNLNFLPDSRKLFNLTLSRLYTRRIYGVREQRMYGPLKDFIFRDYNTLEWPVSSINNPFGASYISIICEGDYPEYQDKSSQVMKANLNSTLRIHKYHEIKAGFEYTYQDFKNFTYFVSDSLHQLIDDYNYQPEEYTIYLQDNIDYKGLYAKLGCRYDYFSSDIDGIKPKTTISPRLGFSFLVTEKFLFRANVGRYTQPPLYDYIYGYFNLLPFPSYLYKYIPLIGNPDLGPEKTTSYEIGLQGGIHKNLSAAINTFYKDVSDLIGTRYVSALPRSYIQYFNVEYANIYSVLGKGHKFVCTGST